MATRFRTSIFLTAFIVGSVAASATAAPVKYTVTPLGQLGEGDVIPNGINDLGQVVGISRPEAFLYSDGVMTGLGMLRGHEESWAKAINNSGVAVGYSALDDDFGSRAVKWENGVITDLGDLGGGFGGGAFGINDTGQIVGTASLTLQIGHAFIWDNGVMTDLGTFGGEDSLAYAINEVGHVVGWSDDPSGIDKPFFWDGTSMSELSLPAGFIGGSAVDVNDSDHAVGWVWDGGPLPNKAVLWAEGEVIDLGTLGTSASPNAMNNLGQIVGGSLLAPNQPRAFLWEDGVMYDLNELLLDFEGTLILANDINDAGQIVAYGNADADFQHEGFLLTPVPEPSTGLVSLLFCTLLLRRPRMRRTHFSRRTPRRNGRRVPVGRDAAG